MGRINTVMQDMESFVYFRNAIYSSYGVYTAYKYIESSKTWYMYSEIAPEVIITYTIRKGTDEEIQFLSDKSDVDAWHPRKRIDVTDAELALTVNEHYNQHSTVLQTILKDLDGYHLNSVAQEHYNQSSDIFDTILKDLDGYTTQLFVNGLNNTISEHYEQHSRNIEDITKSLDGYSTDIGLDDIVLEHYNQHSNAIGTILKDLDGYIPSFEKGSANGVASLDAGGKIPAVQIPAIALPEVHVVADEAARSALSPQEGDEAIQIDDGYHYIYDGTEWLLRPGGRHSHDHYSEGDDEVIAQGLSSGSANEGQIMVADGNGGWNVEDNSPGSSVAAITHQMAFTRNGTFNNSYMSYYEHCISSNQSPAIVPWKSKLIGISFTNRNYSIDVDVEVLKADANNGTSPLTKVLDWELRDVRVASKTSFESNIVFNTGDKIAIYVRDKGTNPHDGVVVLYLQVAADATNGEYYENFYGYFNRC
jgi:hypothetical protein